MQKPSNCADIDMNGLCIKCNTGFQIVFGLCASVTSCVGNQYLSASGVCVDVTPGCQFWNPSTGICLTCNGGAPANNGLCCATGQNAFKGQCISSTAWRDIKLASEQATVPTCQAFHPTIGHCIECNGNFKVNPVNPIECI